MFAFGASGIILRSTSLAAPGRVEVLRSPNAIIKATGTPGHQYVLESRSALTPFTEWIPVAPLDSTNAFIEWHIGNPEAVSQGFFRARRLP
jgi:hypothetical protein